MHFPTERELALSTRESLHTILSGRIIRPRILTIQEFTALDEVSRADYNRRRVRFLARDILVQTPQIKRAHRLLDDLSYENDCPPGDQTNLMVNGESGFGKTTLLRSLMRVIYAEYGRHRPDFFDDGLCPIVYVSIPTSRTPKGFIEQLAQFFGLTVVPNESMSRMKARVIERMNASDVQVVIVDEVQNLSSGNKINGEIIDVLRDLHNHVPATFVYSGFEIIGSSMFSGARGQQVSSRSLTVSLFRYDIRNSAHLDEWRAIIACFDDAMPLLGVRKGQLVKHSTLLFERTKGSIRTLNHLLTGIAIQLVRDNTGAAEEITRELIEAHPVDLRAEERTTPKRATRRAVKAA